MPWELLTVLKSFCIFIINYLRGKFVATNFGYTVFTYFFSSGKFLTKQTTDRAFRHEKNCEIQQSNKRLNSVFQNHRKVLLQSS
jgi:hypothetical protein